MLEPINVQMSIYVKFFLVFVPYGIFHFKYPFRDVDVLLVTARHSRLAKVVFHGRDVVGVTTRGNVYLAHHTKQILVNANLGSITTVFLLEKNHLAQVISK